MDKEEYKKLEDKLCVKKKTAWNSFDDFNKLAFDFCSDYKIFLNKAKSVRSCVDTIVSYSVDNGFSDLMSAKTLNKGDRYYFCDKGKQVALVLGSEQNVLDGVRLIVSHVDSPRLDFKPYPLYEEAGFAVMDSHYYGGIKKYQWVNQPLAFYCHFVLESGECVDFTIGDKDDDPVFVVPDLLVHLSREQMKKDASQVVKGDDLNVLVGSIPIECEDVKDKIKMHVLSDLYNKYGIVEEDFVSAEIEAVPAFKARDVGFDRGLLGGYGHDDKVCVYTSLRSAFECEPRVPTVVLFVDKEEIGSLGNTSARSDFFKRVIEKMVILSRGECHEYQVRDILSKSEALSADVTAGFDPTFKSVFDSKNTSYLGNGVSFEKSGGSGGKYSSNDTNPEFVAKLRSIFNKKGIKWQTGELGAVDEGGGGTVAMFFANYGIEIIDIGPCVLGMHSPFEVVSKADVYSTFLAYKEFLDY
jgi:aspartyl aminopeptidase